MRRFVCLAASLVFTGCGVQRVPETPEATETVPISATAPIPPGATDPLTALNGKTPQERSPAYRKAPDADCAFTILDAALDKAWALDDPRELLAEVIRTAAEVDPVRTCDRVRIVAPRLWKLNLPPTQRNVWLSFAGAVAAQDPNLRDGLLRLAIIDGRRALAADALWKAPDHKPGEGGRDNPKQLLTFGRQMLEFDVRLCEAVLEQRADRDAAIDVATKLFADAKAKGICPLGCISQAYEYEVAENLANLDPALLLPIIVKQWKQDHVAQFCIDVARHRWLDRMRDTITETLARASIDNGGRSKTASEIIAGYESPRPFDTTRRLGYPEIEKPAGVPWVPPADIQKLLDDPTKTEEADSRLCDFAGHIGQWGPADQALDVLNRIKSTYRFVYTATRVARNFIRRYEHD